ncbi:uncharacterized protein LDX57_002854 [Aspergillus melleus]|uniref:uncharacterized protein n=1 Tax=Aspergillus melleus TaxID=138277 RepID=UPI001E8D9AAF|nr:uncharacterized protein LDX57_002854 [Aspergillus melleus]KAH8425105.1 hypothetical protein LDX57_002854 [Aspergillus melleus]
MTAQPQRIGIARALLEHDADQNATDNNGDTPFSSTTGDHALFRLSLQYGADLTTGNEPTLFRAIQNLDAELVQVILEAGVGCNVPFKKPPPHPKVPKVHKNKMHERAAEENYSLWLPLIWFAARMHFEKPDELHTQTGGENCGGSVGA